jgi:(R,R)-butanediol dehydrogenase/meso-butanediol dehydrogenase/diacetyl reductase
MRQVNIHGVDDVRVDHADTPTAGPRDIVLRVSACGICGTDLTFAKQGSTRGAEPMPLGHEVAGVVASVGDEVAGVRPGMRVVVNPMSTEAVIGNGGPEGAFADLLLVREAELGRSLFEIPAGMPASMAALVEPLAVARHAVNRADPAPDAKVVVFGAGPIGLGAVIWLRRRGVRQLVVVDLNEGRLARARALGATDTVLAGQGDVIETLRTICGPASVLGAPAVDVDVFIDAAGAPQILSDVVNMSKLHSKLVVVAAYRASSQIDFRRMLVSELTITTSIGYPNELAQVLAELPELAAEAEIFISHRFAFDDFLKAFDVARAGDCAKVMVEFEGA